MKNKYNRFLSSEWWKYLRNKRLRKGAFCEICNTKTNLQIHHASYENLYKGRASKAIKYTHVLCGDCHHGFHKENKLERDMINATQEYIKKEKRLLEESLEEYKQYERNFDLLCSSFK
jgi:hypothetical protein